MGCVEQVILLGAGASNADFHIKYLLKRAEMFKGETPEIYVINNYKGKIKSLKEDEKQRFTRFLKDKDKIHYTDKSFEDFAQEGI